MSNLGHRLRRVAASGEYEVSYADNYLDTGSPQNVSISVNFGDEHANRDILFIAYGSKGTAPVSLSSGPTIGGVSATEIHFDDWEHGAGNPPVHVQMAYYARVPTGASGTIAFNLSTTLNNITISVWRCVGVNWGAVQLQRDATATPSISFTQINGKSIVCHHYADDGGSCTWTNATEVYDNASGGDSGSGAIVNSTDNSGVTITANVGSSDVDGLLGLLLA